MLCPLTCGLPLQMCHAAYYVLREREGKHRHSFFFHPSFPRLNTDLQPTAATFSPVALINKLLRQLPRQLALLVRFPHSRVSPPTMEPDGLPLCVFPAAWNTSSSTSSILLLPFRLHCPSLPRLAAPACRPLALFATFCCLFLLSAPRRCRSSSCFALAPQPSERLPLCHARSLHPSPSLPESCCGCECLQPPL